MLTTIEKAEKLTRYLKLHQRDTDPIIDGVLDKLLDRERQSLMKQHDELRSELDDFEARYRLNSTDFFEKFEGGTMGDDADFVDWAAAWRVFQSLEASLRLLDTEASPK